MLLAKFVADTLYANAMIMPARAHVLGKLHRTRPTSDASTEAVAIVHRSLEQWRTELLDASRSLRFLGEAICLCEPWLAGWLRVRSYSHLGAGEVLPGQLYQKQNSQTDLAGPAGDMLMLLLSTMLNVISEKSQHQEPDHFVV